MPVLFAREIVLVSSMSKGMRGLSTAALAGVVTLALFVGPAAARETDPANDQYGFTGRYLLILEDRRGRPFRVKTFDPLTLRKKIVYTARSTADYIESPKAAAGTISFYVVRERKLRYRGKRLGSTTQTLITMKDDGSSRTVVRTFKQLGGWYKSCGSHGGSIILAEDGSHYLVERTAGKIAANGRRCARAASDKSASANLLRFADPFGAPTSRPVPLGTYLPGESEFESSTAPDGSGYAFQHGSSISYHDMASGAHRMIAPDPGHDFEGFRLGPGRRMIAAMREDSGAMDLHVYFFPDISDPARRIELTGVKSEELRGRFCGERPLVIDDSKRRYVLFNQLGGELQDVHFAAAGKITTSVGCTSSNLVLAIERPGRRKSRRWVFAPLVP